MGDIDKAIAAIDALDPGEKIPWSKISKEYGVVRSTLTRRYKGISTTRERKAVN
jgi:N-acetyl-anhydromuramyl-L-alanine amidase AmpD